MLNLGDLTVGSVASLGVDEAYIDWMEADAQFVNLMNALEIAVKAQKSESSECLNFAEDLLGCSCEVVTTGSSKKITDNAFTAIESAKKMAQTLHGKAQALYRTLNKNSSHDTTATISVGLANAADRYDDSRFKLSDLCGITTKGNTTLPIANALRVITNAMAYISEALKQFNSDTKSQVRAGFKNEGKGAIKAGGMSVMSYYKRARAVIAALLSGARAGLKACNRAVMQANKPERKRLDI